MVTNQFEYYEPNRDELQHLAIEHLCKQARAAHYDGDGMVVNHLCAIALADVQKWTKQKASSLSLNDIYWAVVLSLYWLSDSYMLREAKNAFTVIQKREEEYELVAIISQLFLLFDRCLDSGLQPQQELLKSNLHWMTENTRCEDLILLNLLIELLWYRDPLADTWQQVAQHWQKTLNSQPISYISEVEQTRKRLLLQNGLVVLGSKEIHDIALDTYFSRPIEKRLFMAWNHLLQCEWDALKNDVRDIVGIVSFEDPVALCISDIHQFFRFQIHFRIGESSESYGDNETIILTRRWVNASNRKADIFTEYRRNRIHKLSAKLWMKRGDGGNIEDQRLCFMLVMLYKLSSLRSWDFASWIDASQLGSELHLELHRSLQDPSYAVDAIVCAIQALSFKDEKDNPTFATAVRSLDKAEVSIRERLVRQLLNTRPLESHRVIDAFYLLSDAIPESCLQKLAEWTVAYADFPDDRRLGWRAAPFGFWEPILSSYIVPHRVYQVLQPAAIYFASRPMGWFADDEGFLQQYLLHAPSTLAIEIAEKMLNININDEQIVNTRWSMLYNTANKRPEFLERFKDDLRAGANTPVRSHYQYYLDNPGSSSKARDDEQLREFCREQISSMVEKVLQRGDNVSVSIGGISLSFASLVKWHEQDLYLIDRVIEAINHPNVYSFEVDDFLELLSFLVMRGGRPFALKLLNTYIDWLKKLPSGKPIQYLGITEEGGIFGSLCLLSIRMVNALNEELIPSVGDWIITHASEANLLSVGTLPYLAIRVGTLTPGVMGVSIVNTIQLLLMRAYTESDDAIKNGRKLKSLLTTISYTLYSTITDEWTILRATNDGARDALYQILKQNLPSLAKHDDADVRAGAALVMQNWLAIGTMPENLNSLYQQLCNDARGRVRLSATKPLES